MLRLGRALVRPLLFALTVPTLCLAGCAGGGSIAPTHVIVSEAFEHPLYIGLYVAKDKGFFTEQGLDVEIVTAGGDAQAFSALTSGKAQFAQGDPTFIAIGHERGWDGRVVAMAVDRVATWGVTFDKSIKPFTNPAGFRNRTVATYPQPNTAYVVQQFLALKAGLHVGKDTKIVQVPFGTELATLQNHRADIAETVEPNVSQVEQRGGTVVFSYPDAWGPLAFTGVMTSKSLIADNSDLVQRYINAYEKALQYIHTDFDGTLAVAQKRFPNITAPVIKRSMRRLVDSASIPAHAKVDPVSWRKAIDVRVKVGDLKSPSPSELVDNTFADKSAH